MLCPYCNALRPANEVPCPQCGAPSPLISRAAPGNYRTSSIPREGTPPGPPLSQQANPPGPFQRAANSPHDKSAGSLWSRIMASTTTSAKQPPARNQQPSLLPVPYQPGTSFAPQQMAVMPQDLAQKGGGLFATNAAYNGAAIAPLAPMPQAQHTVWPEATEAIHIPPVYTKPRAIIPHYRIISGLLSLFIVFILACVGGGYYAQASGKLALIEQLWGGVLPQNLPSVAARSLPNPQLNPDYGPAKDVINSASTASKVDPQTAVALQPSNVFVSGQIIYLTYSVHPKIQGVVVLKWYTDNRLYKITTSKPIAATKNGVVTNGFVSIQYTQPVEGKVEIYWNDQLAIRLFFVVR